MAIVMMRKVELLSSTNPEYIQCLRNVSESFTIPIQLMELLIDVVAGSPVDIFKVNPKQIVVYPETNEISGEFDQTRMAQLSELFKASKQTLTKTFILWFQSYNLVKQGEQNSLLFQQAFSLRPKFVEIVEMGRQAKSQDQSGFSMKAYVNNIRRFIQTLIKQKQNKVGDNIMQQRPSTIKTEELFNIPEVIKEPINA